MAVKVFTIDMNGGDETSADTAIYFKIYGSADSYTTAIATTGVHGTTGVSVSAGTATVTWEVGTETAFKVTQVDEAGNESLVSNEWDTAGVTKYYLNADGVTSAVLGTLTGHTEIPIGGYIEFKFRLNQLTSLHAFMGMSTNITRYIRTHTGNIIRHVDPVSAATLDSVTTQLDDITSFHTLRINRNASSLGYVYDGGTEEVLGSISKSLNFDQLFNYNGVTSTNSWETFDGDIEYVDLNGVKIEFTDTSGVYTVSGTTLTITAKAGVTISDLFTAIP